MAYIFLVIFSLINGYFFTQTFFLINQSDLRSLFNIIPLVFLFFVPAVTMGLIAWEKNSGTIEIMATLPIKDSEFVLGKYFSGLTLILVGIGFTLVHFITLTSVGTNIDYGAVLCGYFGIMLLGAFYSSIGLFASSLTENQVVAFIIAISVVIIFFLLDKVLIFTPAALTGILQYISVEYHLSNISRGVVDSRNIIYFISMIWMFLSLTIRIVEIRKWR